MADWCNRANKVSFSTELDAKIALAERVWKDKGECRYYKCLRHFHLTSQPEGQYREIKKRRRSEQLTSKTAA